MEARQPSASAQPPSRPARLRRVGTVLLAVLLPLVLLVTLWPTHALLRIKPAVVDALGWLHDRGVVEWLTWVRLEVLANVAMVVPLATAVVLVLGARRWAWAVAACAALSIAVEVAQHMMPGRVASVLDVAANTLGAVVGAAVAVVLERLTARRHRSRTQT